MHPISIAIDGPSGVGKTTIARSIAEKKNYLYIDTGAMFRALAVHFLSMGFGNLSEAQGTGTGTSGCQTDNEIECAHLSAACPDEKKSAGENTPGENGSEKSELEAAVEQELPNIRLELQYAEDHVQHMLVNGQDVTDQLRTETVSRMASVTSQYQAVRERLKEMQRELAKTSDVVMDGRDIGTVVLPQATLKVFLTARAHVRAERRYLQLAELGKLDGATLESIEKDIEERDYRDSHREIAPLKPAEDAVIIDTSDITIAEVEAEILSALHARIPG